MKYEITNWRDHQHYKDRNPPWIKLHFSLLSSEDWVSLNDASRVLMVACMLIGSRTDGIIDGSPKGLEYLRRVAYLNTKPNLNQLIQTNFLTLLADASTMLADASNLHTNARPETETEERQIRGETETDVRDFQELHFEEFWKAYPKKLFKVRALDAWKAGECHRHIDAILQSLEKHKVWQDWTRDGGRFIPKPENWLASRGWENDLEIYGIEAPSSPATPLSPSEPNRDKAITHRGFTAAYSVKNGKVDHFLVTNGGNSWRIPSGLAADAALSAIREQIDGKIDGLKL